MRQLLNNGKQWIRKTYLNSIISELLKKGSKPLEFKTKVAQNTCDPEFDERFRMEQVTYDDLRNRIMQISLWQYEKGNRMVVNLF